MSLVYGSIQPSPFQSLSDPSAHLVIVFRELDGLTDWKSLGLQLGLNFSTLSEIQANESDTILCKMAMLNLWLSLRDSVKDKGGATKASLVKALYSMKENVLAHRLETKQFISSQPPTPSSELHTTYMSFRIKYIIKLQECDLHATFIRGLSFAVS